MSVLIAIPARYASSRYPGKPLVPLTGASGVIAQPDRTILAGGAGGIGRGQGRGGDR